ncbi:MAG TPA: M28 family peptidase [Gemmatimonadaceae bacterium]|nr:M28 family peptidase [Gemmatimonadaceae bacterium]
MSGPTGHGRLRAGLSPALRGAPRDARGAVALPTANVAALVPGTDPALRGQVVVVGAHFDHLGRSPRGALDPAAGDAIRNGADDNASGTAAVLELARRFRIQPARRTVLVANFSAEELGLLGSQWMVEHPPVPLDSVQAMVNFDMVGRLRDDRLVVYGTSTARELPALLDSANGQALVLAKVGDGFGPSDHSSFFAQGIPVLHFFTDLHGDYHRATDDADRIAYAGLRRVVDYAEEVARRLANHPRRLAVVRDSVRPTATATTRSGGSRVYLGSIPDMAAPDGVKGLRLTGITPGSPADKAGLQAGDVVVEFGGIPVTDLYTYTDALRSHAPGDIVTVVVMRGGERKAFSVTLGRRER